MQGLKLSELKEGHIYRCLLSGKNVLIEQLIGNPIFKANAISYGGDMKLLDVHDIFDYQLTEIKEGVESPSRDWSSGTRLMNDNFITGEK